MDRHDDVTCKPHPKFVLFCRVQHLSLRYNRISDVGAESLGKTLGSAQKQNTRLISLNLNGNQITDTGAGHLAQVTNTCSGHFAQVTNTGTGYLAQVTNTGDGHLAQVTTTGTGYRAPPSGN